MEKDQEAIGRVLQFLLEGGLGTRGFDSYRDGLNLLQMDNVKEATKVLDDVLKWMLDERLIRAMNVSRTLAHGTTYIGVQLTSKGIAALQVRSAPDEKTVVETLSDNKKSDLAPSTYVKIGALFGGFVGGTIKAIS